MVINNSTKPVNLQRRQFTSLYSKQKALYDKVVHERGWEREELKAADFDPQAYTNDLVKIVALTQRTDSKVVDEKNLWTTGSNFIPM